MNIIIGILGILLGALQAFYGSKLFKLFLPLFSGFLGFLFGIALGSLTENDLVPFVLGISLAILFGVLSGFLWKAGVVFQFGLLGFFLAAAVDRMLGINQTVVVLVTSILTAVVFAYIVYATKAWEWFLVISTTIGGVVVMITGAIALFYGAEVAYGHTFLEVINEIPLWVEVVLIAVGGTVGVLAFMYQVENDPEVKLPKAKK